MKNRRKCIPVRAKVSDCIGEQLAEPTEDWMLHYHLYHLRVTDSNDWVSMSIAQSTVDISSGYDSLADMLNDCIPDTHTRPANRFELNRIQNNIAKISRRGVGKLIVVDGANYVVYPGEHIVDKPFTRHYYKGKAKYTPHPDIKTRCIRIPKLKFKIS